MRTDTASLPPLAALATTLAAVPAGAQENELAPILAPTEQVRPAQPAEQGGVAQQDSEPSLAETPAAAAEITCDGLPEHSRLQAVLREVVDPGDQSSNGGLGNHMWAVVVNREGQVCAVVRSGEAVGDQWPGSRAIAAAKANTANAFSLPGFALSTANVYWPSQPGGSLYGIETSNPADPAALAEGPALSWGTEDDPLVGRRVGGATVFAGGLALYDGDGQLLGALGLSGDESCTDHVIAWKVRDRLNLDLVPDGVTKAGNDNIIFDIVDDPSLGRRKSMSGYGHPECSPRATTIAEDFEQTHPTSSD